MIDSISCLPFTRATRRSGAKKYDILLAREGCLYLYYDALPSTAIWKLHVLLFPLLSTASHVTNVCPIVNSLPDCESQVTSVRFPELSVTEGSCQTAHSKGFTWLGIQCLAVRTYFKFWCFFICKYALNEESLSRSIFGFLHIFLFKRQNLPFSICLILRR